jgi:hypothetical protein
VNEPNLKTIDIPTVMHKLTERIPLLRTILFTSLILACASIFLLPVLTPVLFPLAFVAGIAFNLAVWARQLEDVGEDEQAWSERRKTFAEGADLEYTRSMLIGESLRTLSSLSGFTLFAELRKSQPFSDQDVGRQFEGGFTKLLNHIGLNPMTNLMHGVRSGYRTVIFDYRHRNANEVSPFATLKVTPILLQSERLQSPHFALVGKDVKIPAGFLKSDKLREVRLVPDSLRDTDFRLYGRDRDAVAAFFTPEHVRYFLEHGDLFRASVFEGNGDQLLLYRMGTRLNSEELENCIPVVVGAADALAVD